MSDWSNFGTEVKTHATNRGPKCSVSVMLDALPSDAVVAVARVLIDRDSYTNSAVAKALRERLGSDSPSLWSVSNHRRGNCACAS